MIAWIMKLANRFVASSALLALVGAAHAQEARFKLSYLSTDSFPLKSGDSGRLTGPELGIDLKFQSLGPVNIYFSPSVFLGGKLAHGSDNDGTIYRFMLRAQQNVPLTGFYGFVAAGYAHSQARANEFNDVNAFETQLGAGYSLGGAFLGHFSPNLELSFYQAPRGQLRGVSLGLSVGF